MSFEPTYYWISDVWATEATETAAPVTEALVTSAPVIDAPITDAPVTSATVSVYEKVGDGWCRGGVLKKDNIDSHMDKHRREPSSTCAAECTAAEVCFGYVQNDDNVYCWIYTEIVTGASGDRRDTECYKKGIAFWWKSRINAIFEKTAP